MTEADKIQTCITFLLTKGQLILTWQSSMEIYNHSPKAAMVGRKASDSMLLELLKPKSAPFAHQVSQIASSLIVKSGQNKKAGLALLNCFLIVPNLSLLRTSALLRN